MSKTNEAEIQLPQSGKIWSALHLRKKHLELLPPIILGMFAACFILSIMMICIFIFMRGVPLLAQVGIKEFLFTVKWSPSQGIYGIGAMVVGSLVVTFSALLWAVPLGIGTAVLMAEIAPSWIDRFFGRMIELLAGIPSVVFGFLGVILLVPWIRIHFSGAGFSVLAGAIVLGVMVLPIIINISRESIKAVPREYKEGSLALGATHLQSIRRVILPAAKSGIITAVLLGIGRAIGETMAVVMVTGNSTIIPHSMLDRTRTMTSNIVLEMGYAGEEHQAALFATGVVLFVFIVGLNLLVHAIVAKGRR